MARPKCARRVRDVPNSTFFKPRGIPLAQLEGVTLTFDECEALRLADLDGLYHDAAASKMRISRATFGRIVQEARHKVADALINGKAIRIEGGVVTMAQKRVFQCSDCLHSWEVPFGTGRPDACPRCESPNIQRTDSMRGQGTGTRGLGCRTRPRSTSTSTRENR